MTSTLSTPSWRTPALVLIAGCLISMIGFGVRSTLGLFVAPMGEAGWSLSVLALALAVQNLCWGIGLPFAGMLADRFSARPVIIAGAVVYAIGLYGMTVAQSGSAMVLFAGVLAGTGIAFAAFSIAMAAMVRVVGPEKRTLTLGLGTAAGSLGQVVFSPLALYFIQSNGWMPALVILAFCVLTLIPLAFVLPSQAGANERQIVEQTIGDALSEALTHRGYVLLTVGFFVCGFHVAFITVHFPPYIESLGLPARIGAWSIALIGLFNIAGSLGSGFIGQRYSKKRDLLTSSDHHRSDVACTQNRDDLAVVCSDHGHTVVVDRTADHRHHCPGVWCPVHGHLIWHRIFKPSDWKLYRYLAGWAYF